MRLCERERDDQDQAEEQADCTRHGESDQGLPQC